MAEVYTALHADGRSLAMMGARALLDIVILEKVGDIGTFAHKLSALEKEGYVSSKNRETLEAALDVGNAAAHRGFRPRAEHVQGVMDIIENLIQSTLLHSVAGALRKATPQRKPKAPKK